METQKKRTYNPTPMRVLCLVGTRPEAIKMAPVVKELRRRPGVESWLCSTGQHREMLEPIWRLFDLKVDVELNLMTPNQGLSALASRLFSAIDETVAGIKPDWILAQGDTTVRAPARRNALDKFAM